MALVNPYCTVAEVREEIKNSDTADVTDAVLQDAINAASRWVDRYKGRIFYEIADYSAADLEITDRDGIVFEDEVYLPWIPIISLSLVKVGTQTLVLDTDYQVIYRYNPANGIREGVRLVRIGGNWGITSPDGHLFLRGTFGYDQSGVPSAVPTNLPNYISRAAILVAAALSGHNRKQAVGFDGSMTDINDRAIPKEVFQMLGRRFRHRC